MKKGLSFAMSALSLKRAGAKNGKAWRKDTLKLGWICVKTCCGSNQVK